jgi:hypothetical protein
LVEQFCSASARNTCFVAPEPTTPTGVGGNNTTSGVFAHLLRQEDFVPKQFVSVTVVFDLQ